jgi:hypothetical protein
MSEETLYPVCPDRNVVSAFQCFLGPDSRGPERFFGDQGIHWPGEALLIVRVQGRWALTEAVHELQRGAEAFSRAVTDFNPVLTLAWILATCAVSALTWSSKFLIYRACVAIKASTKEFHSVSLLLGWRRGNDAAALLGRWAAHYRLPVLFGSRTVRGLQV